jgi:hypothetical protein
MGSRGRGGAYATGGGVLVKGLRDDEKLMSSERPHGLRRVLAVHLKTDSLAEGVPLTRNYAHSLGSRFWLPGSERHPPQLALFDVVPDTMPARLCRENAV